MKILKNKKGVSLLEGMIALLLLALVATGTFGVLLSSARKSSEPDIREEMALAVEKAQQMLQVYVTTFANLSEASGDIGAKYADDLSAGLCGSESSGSFDGPLAAGEHIITCLLPPICDRNTSSFTYEVSATTSTAVRPRNADMAKTKDADGNYTTTNNTGTSNEIQVRFKISCNGYTL